MNQRSWQDTAFEIEKGKEIYSLETCSKEGRAQEKDPTKTRDLPKIEKTDYTPKTLFKKLHLVIANKAGT